MSVLSDQAASRGDLMARLDALERQVAALRTGRRLPNASVGQGGIRVHAGGSVRVHGGGSVQVEDGGDIVVQGGSLLAQDEAGERVFEVDTDPAEIFMRPELVQDVVGAILDTPAGSRLIRGLIGNAIHVDSVLTQETTSSTSFTDLATVGPQVTAPVSSTGRALVEFGCVLTTDQSNDHVSMSFEVSGATNQAPSGFRAVQLSFVEAVVQSTSMAVMVEGLAEGANTFTAKYTVTNIGATGFFGNRWMIVTPY